MECEKGLVRGRESMKRGLDLGKEIISKVPKGKVEKGGTEWWEEARKGSAEKGRARCSTLAKKLGRRSAEQRPLRAPSETRCLREKF